MNIQDKTKEQLLNDLRKSEFEIVELKKLEQNHKIIAETFNQERELYSDLANALPVGIYRSRVFHDAALIQEKWTCSHEAPYIIEFANDRFFDILNLNRPIFEKNPGIINDLIFEEDKTEFAKLNVTANLNKTPFLWEGRFMIKGKLIWIHFESIPRVLENGDIIWTGILNDMSERKNAELTITAKNNELQKLNDEKVKFLSIIAHDLKSPFNSIVGFSELLVEKIRIMDYEQIEKYANIILQSSDKAINLLMNLMEWAQSQTGRMKCNPEYFEIVAFINEIVPLYDDIVNQKSITIKKKLPHNATIFADKQMISTVFRNLIYNAIKFTHNGEITISAVEKQNEIIFSISDTGVGIPKNSIEKLFRLDQNYSTPGTNMETGTGMGLILCKEFIEKQRGKIWVESEEGKGSTFYFTIPYNVELETDTKINDIISPEPKDVRIKNLKILIVEDDEISHSLLSMNIDKISSEVLHAISGVEAVEICRNNPDLDLVLMDMRIPEMNGLEATHQIRMFNKDVIIIAQTAYGHTGDREKALEAGCNEYISKPINMTLLMELIKKYVKK